MATNTGILYVATGDDHRQEAVLAATQCKAVMPTLPIALCSDRCSSEPLFCTIDLLPNPSYDYMDKVTGVSRAPFERTLYFDTDTYVCSDVSELFQLLDHFDIAAAHASNRQSTRSTYMIKGVPTCFPELNTGVLVFRSNDATRRLFSEWSRLFQRDRSTFAEIGAAADPSPLKEPGDQSSFREALYKSDLRIATLPPEYNFRFGYSAFAGSEVKVLHGRHPRLDQLALTVNAHRKRRVYVPGTGVVRTPRAELPPDAR